MKTVELRQTEQRVNGKSTMVSNKLNDAILKPRHPDDGSTKTIERVNNDAQELIEWKKLAHCRKISINPLELLEEHTRKMAEFFSGFDGLEYMDFANAISIVHSTMDSKINHYNSMGSDVSHMEMVRDNIIELIQHIGFNRDLIPAASSKYEHYLREIEIVNNKV